MAPFVAPSDSPPPGTYAHVDGAWLRTSTAWPSSEGEIRLIFASTETWTAFRSGFERERLWKEPVGVVVVDEAAVEEIVRVELRARYRGAGVYFMGPGTDPDGLVTVGLTGHDRHVARDLGFTGDERFSGFDKVVPRADLLDVTQDVTVRWRRGVGVV